MGFRDLASQAVLTAFEHLGEDGIYTPKSGGVPRKVRVIIAYDVELFPSGFESSITQSQTQADFMFSEVPSPKRGDKLRADGKSFKVDDILPGGNDGLVTKAVLIDG